MILQEYDPDIHDKEKRIEGITDLSSELGGPSERGGYFDRISHAADIIAKKTRAADDSSAIAMNVLRGHGNTSGGSPTSGGVSSTPQRPQSTTTAQSISISSGVAPPQNIAIDFEDISDM